MIEIKTLEQHASDPRVKDIPWSVFSDTVYFNSRRDMEQDNTLLHVALAQGRVSAAQYLLSLPEVRPPVIRQIATDQNDAPDNSPPTANAMRLYQLSNKMTPSGSGSYVCPVDMTPEFFTDYASQARTDGQPHAALLCHLLSSRKGIMKLFAMLQQGLGITYTGCNDTWLVKCLRDAGALYQSGTVSPEEQTVFDAFINQLDAHCSPDAGSLSDSQLPDFFHANLLIFFIGKYVLPDNKWMDNSHKKTQTVWRNVLADGALVEADYYYTLMKITEFQIDRGVFVEFAINRIFSDDDEQAKAQSLFILDKYAEKTQNRHTRSIACRIAACMARDVLNSNFSQNLDDIAALNAAYLSRNYASIYGRSELETFSVALFIKVAGLLANRFKQYAFLDVLIALSKKAEAVFYSNDFPPFDCHLMYRPGITISLKGVHSVGTEHGMFQDALNDIIKLFSSPAEFGLFFASLEEKLKSRLAHVPVVPSRLLQSNITLFHQSFPGQETMDWYLALSPEQRKLNQALHLTLLEMEQAQGYNLAFGQDDDGVMRFYGFIPGEYANNIVLSRHLFKESRLYLAGNYHGENSHRIQKAAVDFFCEQGLVRLPTGASVYDLLAYIIKNGLWGEMFDHFDSEFGCPHYVMSWLRHAAQFPNLQKAAVFGFCKSMNKFMQTLPAENNPGSYERVFITQMCYGERFSTATPKVTPDTIAAPVYKYVTDKNGLLLWASYGKNKKPAVPGEPETHACRSQI